MKERTKAAAGNVFSGYIADAQPNY